MDASTSNKIKFFINQIIKIKRKVSQIKRKGICYDVGRVMLGNNWRPNFDPNVVHRKLEIIKNDLL
jgi:hypothetical protein